MTKCSIGDSYLYSAEFFLPRERRDPVGPLNLLMNIQTLRSVSDHKIYNTQPKKGQLGDVAVDQGIPTRLCTTQMPSIRVLGGSVASAGVAALLHRVFCLQFFWHFFFLP